jgi:hypothetical protein
MLRSSRGPSRGLFLAGIAASILIFSSADHAWAQG